MGRGSAAARGRQQGEGYPSEHGVGTHPLVHRVQAVAHVDRGVVHDGVQLPGPTQVLGCLAQERNGGVVCVWGVCVWVDVGTTEGK